MLKTSVEITMFQEKKDQLDSFLATQKLANIDDATMDETVKESRRQHRDLITYAWLSGWEANRRHTLT